MSSNHIIIIEQKEKTVRLSQFKPKLTVVVSRQCTYE